jgi:hypothetical protein
MPKRRRRHGVRGMRRATASFGKEQSLLLQWLLQVAAKRHPFRWPGAPAVEPDTYKSRCDTMLSEVYHAHAKIHGPNKLLPADVLPARRSISRQAQIKADAELACGRYAVVH